MSIRLTLICHASTSAVRSATFPVDEPLDPQGKAKASALAQELPRDLHRVDVAWTSPALRARQTAEALGLEATVDPVLRDIDLGRWAGRSFAEVQEKEPDALAAWISRTDAAPHGGEAVFGLLDRITHWLDVLGKAEGRIVAVTHPAVIRAAIVLGIDANPRSFWRIDIGPLCRVSLHGKMSNWTLRSIQP